MHKHLPNLRDQYNFSSPSPGIFAKGGSGGSGGSDGPSTGGLAHESPAAQDANRGMSGIDGTGGTQGNKGGSETTTSIMGGWNASQQALGFTNPPETVVEPNKTTNKTTDTATEDEGTDWGTVAKGAALGSAFGIPGMVMGGLVGYALSNANTTTTNTTNPAAESFREAEEAYANERGRIPGKDSKGITNDRGRGDGGGREEGLNKAQKIAPTNTTPDSTPAVTSSPTDLNPFTDVATNNENWWDNKLRQDAAKRIGLKQMRVMDPRYASLMNTFIPMAE